MNKKLLLIIFFAYTIIIVLLMALPLNSSSELNNITIIHFRGDYFFHALLFIPWAFYRDIVNMKTLPWLLTGLVFAISAEAMQYLLPYRAYNINDVIANTIGIMIGFLLYWPARKYILKKIYTKNGSSQHEKI
jgi:glycopeptide antibiotics resistance protein